MSLINIGAAFAQSPTPSGNLTVCGGLLGALVDNNAAMKNAVASWQAIAPDIRACFAQRAGISPEQLAQRCVTASDNRVAPILGGCIQAVNQARAAQEQLARARQAQIDAAQRAAKEREEAAERMAKEQADAAARARREQLDAIEHARKLQQEAIDREHQAQLAAEAEAKAQKEERLSDLTAKYGADDAAYIVAGQVMMGMTTDEVLEARGRPGTKDIVPPSDELWGYSDTRIVLSNGKVTFIGK
jgi:hypothetical protein